MRAIRRRLSAWIIQKNNQARRAAAAETEPEPDPDPGPTIPAYIEAAIDGYVSQEFGTEWTTNGADADSGTVTVWPSLNGTLPNMTFLGTPTVDATGPLRAVNGSARGRCSADLPATHAMIALIKPGTSLQIYLSRNTASIKALYLNGSTLSLSDDPTSVFGTYTLADWASAGWNAVGFIFPASGQVAVFVNGTKLTRTTGKDAAPLAILRQWGFGRFDSSSLSDFKIAEWLIYSGDTTDEQMIAWTAEAKARLDA